MPAEPTPVPVAVVLRSFDPGGTERQMSELIRRLDRRRFRVFVACIRKQGTWLPRVEAAAEEVAEFKTTSFKSPSMVTALHSFRRWLRHHRIAVVQSCDLPSNIFALTGAALARVPVRIGSRRDILPPGQTATQVAMQRHAYRLAHRIVTNSAAGAAQLQREGVPSERIRVIPNGVELTAFAPTPERRHRRVVTTVANLRPEKGYDVLLRAARLVRQRIPGVRFRIIGDGQLRDALPGLARELGVEDVVEFLGHREDVAALLADSDVFAFPSRTEAFPNGLIEGMAAGLPVVSSAAGGMLELIDDRRNGLLVPVGDEDALAAALVELLQDHELAERLSRAGRQTIEARYSFDRMVSAFEDLYLSELAARIPSALHQLNAGGRVTPDGAAAPRHAPGVANHLS